MAETDPSRAAAQPVRIVSNSEFANLLRADSAQAIDTSPAAEANHALAASELSMIFELRDSQAFRWFLETFIDKPYDEAFRKLRDPHIGSEALDKAQTRYLALREIKVGMLEHEIAHRNLINPKDGELPELRRRLSLL